MRNYERNIENYERNLERYHKDLKLYNDSLFVRMSALIEEGEEHQKWVEDTYWNASNYILRYRARMQFLRNNLRILVELARMNNQLGKKF